MRKLSAFIFLVAFFACISFSGGAQTKAAAASDCEAAQSLVGKFIKLDAEIGRVSTEAYKKHFDPIILYKIDGEVVHEEPAWDVLTVVRGYKITECQQQADKAYPAYRIKVSYESLGELSHGAADGQCPLFAPKRTKLEEENFEVWKVKNEFKVRLAPKPHVSIARGLEWVEKGSQGCLQEKAEAERGIHNAQALEK